MVELFVSRSLCKPEPREGVIFAVTEDLFERLCSVPAYRRSTAIVRFFVIRYQNDMCPTELVCNRLECLGDFGIRAGHAHHCVVGHVIIKNGIAAPFREERSIVVTHKVTGSYTHCISITQPIN